MTREVKKMNKTQERMFELARKNRGEYETRKYVYRTSGEGGFYRVEKWKFGTTAILADDAFEYFYKER